jgi:hypothetical protein
MHRWSSLDIPVTRGPDSPRRIAPAAGRLRGATPGSERPRGSATPSATGVRLGRVGRSSGARRSWCTHHARRAIVAEAGMSGAKPWSSRSWNSSMCREWPVTAIKPVSRSDIPASATIAGSVARDPWNGRRERVGLVGDKDAARVDSSYVISSLEGWYSPIFQDSFPSESRWCAASVECV